MRTPIVLLLAFAVAAGCSRGGPSWKTGEPGPEPGGPVVLPVASGAASTPLATRPSCTAPAPAGTPSDRELGIDAFLADRPRVALEILTRVSAADPRDRAAEAFRAAAAAKLAEAQARAADAIQAAPRVFLETLPPAHTQRRPVAAPLQKVHLERVSEARNAITDNADWEARNGLVGLGHRRDARLEDLPPKLGTERLTGAFVHPDHIAGIYGTSFASGTTIAIVGAGRRPVVFDARRAWGQVPRALSVELAQAVGDVLLVALAYNGYAKDSGGKNAYFAAYDLGLGTLAWSSEPLVSNAREAVVSGGSIVTGYGFTAEPDFLFALDLATGKVDQRIPLKSGPEAIRLKGDRLFVRTYDTDYVFKSTTGFAPPPAARLPRASPEALPEIDPEARCWVRHATAAIAARDAGAIHEARERLKPMSRDRVLDDLLRSEEDNVGEKGRLDLAGAPLVAVPAPPWDAYAATPAPSTPAPKLVKVSSRAASPTRNMNPVFDPRRPWFIAPVKKGALPDGVRQDLPTSFGQESLSAILPDERPQESGRAILVYGGRYVALLAGDRVERVLDLDAFRHPPKATPQWKEFATQNVTYAQERDGVLYVCNGGGSYAKEVFGKKGFLSAIQATTGKLLWRSAPLTCNATFGITGDHVISGYGFTGEPDFVFVVRRADGAIVQRVPIDSGPETITLSGDRAHVEAYGHVIELDLKVP